MSRKISLAAAKAAYPHRFTLEHVPAWARQQRVGGSYYAPQYRNDAEWYERTYFPGEAGIRANARHAQSNCPTWPLGQSLQAPYPLEN
jgi:septal ring-binding cell division protein DamX